MALKAASEAVLGNLHSQVARVFTKVLQTYEKRLDAIDNINTAELTEDVLNLLMNDNALPNPAMLAAITKFLRDNTISFDTREIEHLSATQERLNERRKKRTNLVHLSNLAIVASDDG